MWMPLLAVAFAAFAVEIPFFFLGTPSGHDVEFHLYSWLDVITQWKHGFVYPRWAALAHFGYGEPRFVFYPPASWMLGAAISTIFPWTIAPSVYIWLVLTASGAMMFLLVRNWLDRRDAAVAAVLYAINPYHLVIVYWRSAFAELLAASLIPLLLLCLLRIMEGEKQFAVPLGLVLAGSWLTNAPAAVMIHYSIALLALLFAVAKKSPRLLLVCAAAVALGACLAAFYLLPAIYEQKWVTIGEAVSAGSRPQDNFLFAHTSDADHDAFNKIVSWVAAFEMGIIGIAGVAAMMWNKRRRELWAVLMVWATACAVLMFPWTLAAWKILPKMQFMQFPWRWTLCLSVIFTVLVSSGLRRWWGPGIVCALSIAIIIVGWHRVQAPWWDNASDLREMQDNIATAAGYEGTDEYTPSGTEPSAVEKEARNVTIEGPARAAIHVLRWDAEDRVFTAEMSGTDLALIKLFPYPAWRISVDGHPTTPGSRVGTGQMVIPVHAGMNRVEIIFAKTWDRVAGGWISLLTALGVILWMMFGDIRRARSTVRT
jgi:6-pyruvoyl-tetrahydropterin synthase related domain